MKLKFGFVRDLLILAGAIFALSATQSCRTGKLEQQPKYLWICAESNYSRLSSPDSIRAYLHKAKDAGFNSVVVDVKPLFGTVMYKSDIFEQHVVNGDTVSRDWDYLQTFIDIAHGMNMKVTASACTMPVGSPYWHRGVVYDDSTFVNRVCLERRGNDSLMNIIDDPKQVGAFLNPAVPENCAYARQVFTEVVSKYDVDGVALDYCRFPDGDSDFSETTKKAFEKYLGTKIENFPADIFMYDENGDYIPGRYFKQWWAWRAQLITDMVKSTAEEVKAINPKVKVEYWAASWIHGLYKTGQNWASPKSDFCLDYLSWGSAEYKAAGFAPYIDRFMLGAYLERVNGADDAESVEYALNRANGLVGDDCDMLGTLYAANHHKDFADAVYLCLVKSKGLMVFDMVLVERHNLWGKIKEGIDRAEAELSSRK